MRMNTTFSNRRGELILPLPNGREHCANRNVAGESFNYRRLYARHMRCRGAIADYGGRTLDEVLTARAARLRDPLVRRFLPITMRLPCPCCGHNSGGKARLNERGRQLLRRKRQYRGC